VVSGQRILVAAAQVSLVVNRWLVTGATGQLGSDVTAVLHMYGEETVACDRSTLDISSPESVEEVLTDAKPRVVINCAAYTAVDAAEKDEETAFLVNADGPDLVARWCYDNSARLVHVSTDYVFAGRASTPYDEDSAVAPKSAYGRSKAAGERAVLSSGAHAFVVRTAWLYGAVGGNFVKTIARLAATRETVDVVDDQVGAPTWSLHLARGLVALAASPSIPGIYHCTNAGEASWFVFTRAIFAEMGLDPARVQPTTTDAFPRPAPRPRYSVLSTDKWAAAGLPEMAHWRDALHEAFVAVGEELTEDS
jgi:dTDP-4-dehydrorhamnose reductase